VVKVPEYKNGDPAFLVATINLLLEVLQAQNNLVEHLLDCDPVTDDELEIEIRETQKRIKEKTDMIRRNVIAAIEGREVELLDRV
jgi:hypothetical protein